MEIEGLGRRFREDDDDETCRWNGSGRLHEGKMFEWNGNTGLTEGGMFEWSENRIFM
jgi:hypothetical protein